MYHQKYLKYKQKYLSLVSSLQQKGGARGKKIVLFAISANPPTLSHIKIVTQLSSTYDHVVVWTSTNPLKTNIEDPIYDPHYLEIGDRVSMFQECVLALDLPNVVFLQEYSDIYSGVSICKYITANLDMIVGGEEESVDGIRIPFKKFTVKSDRQNVVLSDGDVLLIDELLSQTIGVGQQCELWICFGKDVVADTPNWSYNNLFLTLATGIVMIDRDDGINYADPKYGDKYNIFVKSERGGITIKKTVTIDEKETEITETYFTMPCINISMKRMFKSTPITTKELVIASMNKEWIGKFPQVVPENITSTNEGTLCIVEKKKFDNLGDNSSSRVRNYMMVYHLTDNQELKDNIYAKLLEMVPTPVLSIMVKRFLYTIPEIPREIPEDLVKREKILEKFGLCYTAKKEKIIEEIRKKESKSGL